MPNWCSNIVEIVAGSSDDLDGVMRLLSDTTEPFSAILSVPAGVDTLDWHRENWGTKWDAEAFEISRVGSHIEMTFDTAWSPPVGAITALADKFPSLDIRLTYEEPGMCFTGCATFGGGRMLSDDCRDMTSEENQYDEDGDENPDFIPLIDRF